MLSREKQGKKITTQGHFNVGEDDMNYIVLKHLWLLNGEEI